MAQTKRSKPSAFGTAAPRPTAARSAADVESARDTEPAQQGAATSVEAHPFSPALVRKVAAMPPKLPADAVVSAFGTRLPPEMQRMIKTACAERGIRMQDATYEAFWNWLHR